VTFVLDKTLLQFSRQRSRGRHYAAPGFSLNAPSDSIIGSIKTRDGRVGVVDLRRHFSRLPNHHDQNRIILVNFNSIKAGLVVDAIGEILIANENMIQPPPTIITSQNVPFIKAIITTTAICLSARSDGSVFQRRKSHPQKNLFYGANQRQPRRSIRLMLL
jgi:hypothetical protein